MPALTELARRDLKVTVPWAEIVISVTQGPHIRPYSETVWDR